MKVLPNLSTMNHLWTFFFMNRCIFQILIYHFNFVWFQLGLVKLSEFSILFYTVTSVTDGPNASLMYKQSWTYQNSVQHCQQQQQWCMMTATSSHWGNILRITWSGQTSISVENRLNSSSRYEFSFIFSNYFCNVLYYSYAMLLQNFERLCPVVLKLDNLLVEIGWMMTPGTSFHLFFLIIFAMCSTIAMQCTWKGCAQRFWSVLVGKRLNNGSRYEFSLFFSNSFIFGYYSIIWIIWCIIHNARLIHYLSK